MSDVTLRPLDYTSQRVNMLPEEVLLHFVIKFKNFMSRQCYMRRDE